jgi:hypothetical protein
LATKKKKKKLTVANKKGRATTTTTPSTTYSKTCEIRTLLGQAKGVQYFRDVLILGYELLIEQ